MGIAGRVAEAIINNHHMLLEAPLCSRFRTPKSDCSLCVDACPAEAIRLSDGGPEITGGCIDCGVCFSACPNGAFSIQGRSDEKIVDEIESFEKGKGVFRISCERGDAKADLIVPCLGRLTEGLLLESVRMSVVGIEIAQPSCEECSSAKAAPHLDKILQRAQALYDLAGLGREKVYRKRIPFQSLIKAPEKSVSRRELFGVLRSKAAGIAAASIPDGFPGREKESETLGETLRKRPANRKRLFLLDTLKKIALRSPAASPGSASETSVHSPPAAAVVTVPSRDSLFAKVEVNADCIACGVCAALCPTGAITQRWTEDRFFLNFRHDLCTNCQVCLKTCMRKAISMREMVFPELLREPGAIALFEAGKKTCTACRMDFIGEGAGICPLCIDRHKRQQAAIQGLFK